MPFAAITVFRLGHLQDLRKAGKEDAAHRFYATLTEAQRREVERYAAHLNAGQHGRN